MTRAFATPPSQPQTHPVVIILALLLIAALPSLGVWFAAFAAPGPMGSAIWMFAKVGLVAGPVLCWRFLLQRPLPRPGLSRQGVAMGIATGLLLMTVIIVAYGLIAVGRLEFSDLRSVVQQAGIDSVERYLAVALYLTLVNSLIEEYVFRWYMVSLLRSLMPVPLAIFVSGLLFTLHHTLVLSAYLPWQFNLLASIGVLTGGLCWSWLYARYQRIWPSYLSHIGADIGVFIIGYHALFAG